MKGLDPEVEILFINAMETLKGLRAEIREIEIPALSISPFSGYTIVTGEAASTYYEWLQTRPGDYSADIHTLKYF